MNKMTNSNLQPLKGFRDYLPEEAEKRDYVKSILKNTFQLYGFEPLETPALEYQELLLEKYGSEADKLVYKFKDQGGRGVALRYDQTVPTARVLAMYQQQLPMPWRRYQIQNAWRAEKPQKGRLREFTQCDIDIFGSLSPLSDAELLAVGDAVLKSLGFAKYKIYINDRNILFNIMNKTQIPENIQLSIIQSIDKLDKKSREEVEEELLAKNLKVDKIHDLFNEIGNAKPTDSLRKVMDYAKALGIEEQVMTFVPELARGLDYYTSTIYEFVIDGYTAGSVAGGGRYDKLIEKLSGVDIPATGFSFGFDRLIEASEQFGLLPNKKTTTEVLVTVFNSDLVKMSALVTSHLRENQIASEVYPADEARLDKQLKYADKKGIKWLVVIGPDEVNKDTVVLKNLQTGHQEDVPLKKIVAKIRK